MPRRLYDRDIDIAVLGESSAEGVPFNRWTSIGRILQWQLESIFPGREIRLQVLAFSGHTLEEQQGLLTRLSRRPEILIIYCGHNELSSRTGSTRDTRHYFDDQLPTPWTVVVERIESFSPVCGLIRETADKFRVAIPPPRHGNRALIDVPAYTLAEYSSLLADFRRRLNAIVAYAERIGAVPVLDLAARQRRRIRAQPIVSCQRQRRVTIASDSHAIFWPRAARRPSIPRAPRLRIAP